MKKILTSFLILTTIFACKNPEPNNTLATSDNEKLIKQYFEHFNNHDWTKMAALYSETSNFKDPSLGQGVVTQTRQQIIDKYSELHKTFPDLHDNVIEVYPSGDKNMIVEFVSTGTAQDGSKFELSICTIFTIENGAIVKDFTYYDNFEEPQEENNKK